MGKKKIEKNEEEVSDSMMAVSVWTVILLAICLFNVHFEVYEKNKIKTFEIDGFKDVYAANNLNSIYCDQEVEACYSGWNCPSDVPIHYQWSNKNKGYLSFSGWGLCTIEYPVKRLRLTWL